MPTILDDICRHKKGRSPPPAEGHINPWRTDLRKATFIDAIAQAQGLGIIAEVKESVPSKGVITADFDPEIIARKYEKGGASALSVLTDEKYFQGSLSYLTMVREAASLPVLRKDFIIDPGRCSRARYTNADAMLLIAAVLAKGQMEELYSAALELGLDPLIEIHSMQECERVLMLSRPRDASALITGTS